MDISFRHFAVESDWRENESLRTNLWLIPAAESVAAVLLFVGHAEHEQGRVPPRDSTLPSWVISGSPDAARQILSSLAAAIITVVGVVFSIMIVTLTLASSQFGPRMLRTFIRDRGTQLTLGTFVATFFYAMLALISIGEAFVPHLLVTVALALTAVDLGVLIYFIHHTATVDPAAGGHLASIASRPDSGRSTTMWRRAPRRSAELVNGGRRPRSCRPGSTAAARWVACPDQRLPALRAARHAGRGSRPSTTP